MSAELNALRAEITSLTDPVRAAGAARFFKTGPGEDGEGDRFLGIPVPALRRVAKAHKALSLPGTVALLQSEWHEERLVALLILVIAHRRGTPRERLAIHRAYLASTHRVNNWDLVDTSASELVGSHIPGRGTPFLEKLARSPSLWERRISMIATFWTIRHGDVAPTLLIASRLLNDEHDLIHKAVGWMLREAANRNAAPIRAFLTEHATRMRRAVVSARTESGTAASTMRLPGACCPWAALAVEPASR